MSFKPGDTVKLKSGGDIMTVESIGDGQIDCVWSHDHKVNRDSFDPAVLKEYDKAASRSTVRTYSSF